MVCVLGVAIGHLRGDEAFDAKGKGGEENDGRDTDDDTKQG